MSRFKDKYKNEVLPKIKEEFAVKNDLAAPKLKKIVLNIGAGDAKDNQGVFDKVVSDLGLLAGQKPVVTLAKKSISGFKLSQGQPVGAMVTLRGNRMYDFLDKLISIVFPKVRDFRGLSANSFDERGNYTLGLREQNIFPEVTYQGTTAGSRSRGMEISIITTAKTRNEGKKLLELFGFPFVKN